MASSPTAATCTLFFTLPPVFPPHPPTPTPTQAMEDGCLAVMVPLMIRALRDRSAVVNRRTSIIIENMSKLVGAGWWVVGAGCWVLGAGVTGGRLVSRLPCILAVAVLLLLLLYLPEICRCWPVCWSRRCKTRPRRRPFCRSSCRCWTA